MLGLESWLTDRRQKSEIIRPEIQKVNLIDRRNLFKKRPRHQDSITLVLIFHTALHSFWCIKEGASACTKDTYAKALLPKSPRVAFRNPKTLRDKLVRSKLKLTDDAERGNLPCGRDNCEICNILKPGKELKSTLTGEIYKMNFHFDCNSLCALYLITCKKCKKQYTGSTVTKFRARFNQYKSNLELYGEGRRAFYQEKLIEHFFNRGHNGSYKDMMVQIIDFCCPHDQEKIEDFWIHKLRTLYPEGLNMKKINQLKCFNWVVEYIFCCLILIISKELINIKYFWLLVEDIFYCLTLLMTSLNSCYILTCHVKLLLLKAVKRNVT